MHCGLVQKQQIPFAKDWNEKQTLVGVKLIKEIKLSISALMKNFTQSTNYQEEVLKEAQTRLNEISI